MLPSRLLHRSLHWDPPETPPRAWTLTKLRSTLNPSAVPVGSQTNQSPIFRSCPIRPAGGFVRTSAPGGGPGAFVGHAGPMFIKSDALNIGYRETGLIQAVSEGRRWECLVVLYPGKSLLLSGRNNSTTLHQAAGRIVVASGNAHDVQRTALLGFTTSHPSNWPSRRF